MIYTIHIGKHFFRNLSIHFFHFCLLSYPYNELSLYVFYVIIFFVNHVILYLGKLRENVSDNRILDIRNRIEISSGRKMLIEKKKDAQNIKRDFSINGSTFRH